MRITDVETVTLYRQLDAWGMGKIDQDIVLIRIQTDGGITGISYLPLIQMFRKDKPGASGGSHARPIVAFISDHFKPLLVGEDPAAIERLWELMYGSILRFNRKGPAMQCLGALDVALWDIKGKVANLPVYQLLGGYRDRCLAYVNCNHMARPEDAARKTGEYVAMGYKAVKVRASRFAGSLEDAIERARLVREAIGKDVKLLLDVSQDWDVSTTIRMAKKLEPYDIFVLEGPIHENDVRGYTRLCETLDVPIACGAHLSDRWEFLDRIERRAGDMFNPDVFNVGGITEWMKIAALASAAGIPMIPHACEQVHIHLVCASPVPVLLEHFEPDMPAFGGFFHDLFNMPDDFRHPVDGYVAVPQRPGLGLEVNEDLVVKHRVA